MKGGKRLRSKKYPPGIDASKLPTRCYWDGAKEHWYTVFDAGGRAKRARIAGKDAMLSDLHRIMEQRAGSDVDNVAWLRKLFFASVQYTQVAKGTQKDYAYCSSVVEAHPSKLPSVTMGKVSLSKWHAPVCQKLIDQIAVNNGPSTAAHCARYLRRLFNWSLTRGHIKASPMGKIELPKERKQRRLPEHDVLGRLIPFAQERGALPAHTKGSCAPYIWKVLVIGKLCRLRGVEIFGLTDAAVRDDGLYCARTKGSKDSITRWNDELKTAVAAAKAERDVLWTEMGRPTEIRPEKRPLIVGQDGVRITTSTWQSAWKRFLAQAVAAKLVEKEERFGLHDLKRRSITDTKGGRSAKLDAGGHKDARMLEVYDFEVPLVDAAGT